MKKLLITIIRMTIGWHFLYEGLVKLMDPNWSAESFLTNTFGFTSDFYQWLAASPERMQLIDWLNIYGLIGIGLCLFLGIIVRWSSLAGIALLISYYFAYPPFGISLLGNHDGSVFIVNKIFIEVAILTFICLYKEKGYGIGAMLQDLKKGRTRYSPKSTIENRREAIKNLTVLPVLGAMGWGAWENNKKYQIDASSGATIQINRVALNQLKGELPKGKIGGFEISRLVMGGNLIG